MPARSYPASPGLRVHPEPLLPAAVAVSPGHRPLPRCHLPFPCPTALLIAVSTAVDKIVAHFSAARNLVQKVRAWAEALPGLGWAGGRAGGAGFGQGGGFGSSEGEDPTIPPCRLGVRCSRSPPSPLLALLSFRPSWETAGSAQMWGTCCCTPSALRSTPWWRMG